MRFQKFAFSLSSTTHRSIRVHTTVLLRFRLSTLKRSTTNCTLGRKLNHMRMRQAHAPAIFSVIVFIFVRFSTANTNTICGFVLIHFHEHFQIDAAQRFSVDERPKRIQMCAFSNEKSLV